MQNYSKMAATVMFAGLFLLSGTPARAQSEENQCSNRTIRGDYGFSLEGIILSVPGVVLPPGVTLPIRGVAMTHFDGKGNLTQVDYAVVNGMPPDREWTPGTGTYKVNADCTGSLQIVVPGNPFSPIKLHFVVVRDGKEIRTVVGANAVSSIGIRID